MLAGQGNFLDLCTSYGGRVPCLIIFDSGTSAAMVYDSAVEAGLKERYLSISSFLSGSVRRNSVFGDSVGRIFRSWSIAPDLLYHDCDFYHSSFPDLDAERTKCQGRKKLIV